MTATNHPNPDTHQEKTMAPKTVHIATDTMQFSVTMTPNNSGQYHVTVNDDPNNLVATCSFRNVAIEMLDFMGRMDFQRFEIDGDDFYVAGIADADVSLYAKSAGEVVILAAQFAHGVASASVLQIGAAA